MTSFSRFNFETAFLRYARWASIVFFASITIFPLFYLLAMSFKPVAEVVKNPGNPMPSWSDISNFDAYRAVFRAREDGGHGFLLFIRNSAIVSLVTVSLTLAVGILAAYAAARLNFFGKRAVSAGILMVYLFPTVVVAIPLFVMLSKVKLRGSLFALMIVYLAQALPITIYMLRNYFATIPKDLEEAAMIDGLSRFGVIRKVVIPLAAPSIAATGLYVFMIAWNEFLFAMLFVLDKPDLWTISLGVQQLDSSEVPRTVLMAGSVVITIPVIMLFGLAERFMTEGLTAGSVKG